MEKYIKNFSEFLAEQNSTPTAETSDFLQESILLYVDEFSAIMEALGSLQGLPSKWINVIAGRYDNLGGENSIRTTVPIKATQKKKVFGYLKDGYEGTPVLAMMGFTEGQPAFMIYKDKYSWSAKSGKWKIMIGDEVYDQKIRKSAYRGGRYGGYDSWTEVKNAFGEKDIMDALPDGEFEMQLITIDQERMRLRRERTEIAKVAGIKSTEGLQKSTVYKVILGKIKPQIDTLVASISNEIKNNIVGVIDDIFNPAIDYPGEISADVIASIDKLKSITKKLKEARYTIDRVFPKEGHISPETLFKDSKSEWKWDVEKIDKLKALIKNGIEL